VAISPAKQVSHQMSTIQPVVNTNTKVL